MQVQERHVKLSFFENFESFRASGKGQGFHAGGIQDFSDHLANQWFIVHDQTTPLHIILRILTITQSAGSTEFWRLAATSCELVQIEMERWAQMRFSICLPVSQSLIE
jgi:hypothetical protein